MTIRILALTEPTPLIAAYRACHMITPFILLNNNVTFRAFLNFFSFPPLPRFEFSVEEFGTLFPWVWILLTIEAEFMPAFALNFRLLF
jgi:hypothetical protein